MLCKFEDEAVPKRVVDIFHVFRILQLGVSSAKSLPLFFFGLWRQGIRGFSRAAHACWEGARQVFLQFSKSSGLDFGGWRSEHVFLRFSGDIILRFSYCCKFLHGFLRFFLIGIADNCLGGIRRRVFFCESHKTILIIKCLLMRSENPRARDSQKGSVSFLRFSANQTFK